MKIAVIDHIFHQKTMSSNFFMQILKDIGKIDCFYLSINRFTLIAEVADAGYDLVILWQTEYCAPYFLACGIPVLIVPMYDGCNKLPSMYWESMIDARILSFSRALHKKFNSLNLDSYYLQYFPNPQHIPIVEDFDTARGFIWQRRPNEGIDWNLALKLCQKNLDALHIHINSDQNISSQTLNEHDVFVPSFASTSCFEKDNKNYIKHLSESNLFFAPRLSEGIGMAFLEAMARGMVVIAHDDSTHNEYIINQFNGYLYNINHIQPLSLSSKEMAQMGKLARISVEMGYDKYQSQIEECKAFIVSTPKPSSSFGKNLNKTSLLNLARWFISNPKLHRLMLYRERGKFISDKKLTVIDKLVKLCRL